MKIRSWIKAVSHSLLDTLCKSLYCFVKKKYHDNKHGIILPANILNTEYVQTYVLDIYEAFN